MRHPVVPAALGLAVAIAAAAAGVSSNGVLAMSPAPRSPELPRARDGDVAIREELDAARKAGTRAAYDLFIARHPDHPLARTARQERERLK